jgi:hypothetical protein
MNPEHIAIYRLYSQQLLKPQFKTPQDLVSWMGAMQAQDYAMSKWAAGSRMLNSSLKAVEQALHSGEIIRTHVMRPTWHLVAAQDVHWMLELTSPHVLANAAYRYKQLGLDAKLLKRTGTLIEKALRDNRHLTREELMEVLRRSRIDTTDQRAAHILFDAELKGIIASGATQGHKITYALLDERVPHHTGKNRDEALAELALRYFSSHGPATLQDFCWWSGLTVKDAKAGIAEAGSKLTEEHIDGNVYWYSASFSAPRKIAESLLLLPAYDEFMISYRDRSALLEQAHTHTTISSNGIFYPIIVRNGKVIGTWKRSVGKGKLHIETQFFKRTGNPKKQEIIEAAEPLVNFLGLELSLK